jgi:peptidyl-prolyl cis-trans isomerase SurA
MRSLRSTLPLLAALAMLAVLPRAGRAAEAGTVERIVAVVNNEVVLLSELKERASQIGQTIDDTGPPEARRKAEQQLRQVLDRLVDDLLVLQQATELKLAVEEAEVDRAIEEVKKNNNLTTEQFAEALGAQGYTLASYRKDLRKQLLRLKVINTAVRSHINLSDEDVKAFYEQTARRAGGHRTAHVRHVLVALPDGIDDRAREQRQRLAARVLEEARAGADFAKLALAYSDDAVTRDAAGDLGWLKEGEGLPEALSEVIFNMDVSEVRGPIRVPRGFEIVQLVEKKDGEVRPFAEVKDQIRQQLYGQQMEKQTTTWLTDLRKKAHIDVRL